MEYVKTDDIYEQFSVSSQRTFPAAPFPRKYIHCIIDDLHNAVQAVHALRADGFDTKDIHVMASWDFVEAIERRYQQKSRLSRALMHLFINSGFCNTYLHHACRGHHFLAVRLSRYQQMEQVRDLLAPYHTHLMKYIDTWTIAELLP